MSEKKEIKVAKIVIKMGNKEAELDIQEVKDLKKVLDELFPEPEIQIVERNRWYPYYPVSPRDYYCPKWEITWCGTSNDYVHEGDSYVHEGDTQVMYLTHK